MLRKINMIITASILSIIIFPIIYVSQVRVHAQDLDSDISSALKALQQQNTEKVLLKCIDEGCGASFLKL